MSISEVNFQSAWPEHLPPILEMLESANMRDHRRDTVSHLRKVLEDRSDAIIVGISDNEVVVSAYVGDILPEVSAVVVRDDCRDQGLGTRVLDEAEERLAFKGHKYMEVVVGPHMEAYYRKLGFYATDTCTLMERPIMPSGLYTPALPTTQRPYQKKSREFDYKNVYSRDVYHAAFTALVRACVERPSMSYVEDNPRFRYQTDTQGIIRGGLISGVDPYVEGSMLQVEDAELRGKGVFGWAALSYGNVEMLKCLNQYADVESSIWTPFRGEAANGVHYVRPREYVADSPILPILPLSGVSAEFLGDTPSNLNLLVATAQKLTRRESDILQ